MRHGLNISSFSPGPSWCLLCSSDIGDSCGQAEAGNEWLDLSVPRGAPQTCGLVSATS